MEIYHPLKYYKHHSAISGAMLHVIPGMNLETSLSAAEAVNTMTTIHGTYKPTRLLPSYSGLINRQVFPPPLEWYLPKLAAVVISLSKAGSFCPLIVVLSQDLAIIRVIRPVR
jgi:hypothetical protein